MRSRTPLADAALHDLQVHIATAMTREGRELDCKQMLRHKWTTP